MDKRQTLILKAFAIIIMFSHHLFGCGTYLTKGIQYEYFPRIYPLTTSLNGGGKICISLFAFASGYGMYKSYISNDKRASIFKYIMSFMIQYWVVLIGVAIPYLILFDKFNPNYLLINMFAFLHNDEILYITLAWYVKVNLVLLIICPMVRKISSMIDKISIDFVVFIMIPSCIYAVLPDYEVAYVGIVQNSLSTIKVVSLWFVVYYVGVVMAKYGLIERIRIDYGNETKCLVRDVISIVIIMLTLFLQFMYGDDPIHSAVRVTLFVLVFDWLYYRYNNIKYKEYAINKILLFIGKYSFQYWLLSGMFYRNTTEFTWLLYWPRFTLIILIWNFIILTPFAFLTKKIAECIMNIIEICHKWVYRYLGSGNS